MARSPCIPRAALRERTWYEFRHLVKSGGAQKMEYLLCHGLVFRG